MSKQIAKSIIFVVFNLLFISVVFYVFYEIYMFKNISDNYSNEKVSELELKIGTFQYPHKKSSYSDFWENKPANIIRIGCFGDSFTLGDEVNDKYDYPTILQELLDTKENIRYQVLNFGVGWHGFHQSYILLDHFTNMYNLDYIVLGPESFQHQRDSTFNHTYSDNYIYGRPEYLHSRYVLDGNEVVIKNVDGKSVSEKMRDYWSFIPRMQYIKYDYEIPVILRAPLAILMPQKKILNPFYYKDNMENEMNSIYKILIEQASKKLKLLIVSNYNKKLLKQLNDSRVNNTVYGKMYRPSTFLYKSFGHHNSPLGNRLVAEQILSLLQSKNKSELQIIRSKKYYFADKKFNHKSKINIGDYSNISINIEDHYIGNFYNTSYEPYYYCMGEYCDSFVNTFGNSVSLIGLFNGTLVESVYIDYHQDLKESMTISLRIVNRNGVKEFVLDTIKFINAELNIGYFDLGKYKYNRFVRVGSSLIGDIVFNNINKNIYPFRKGDKIYISVDGVDILSSEILGKDKPPHFIPNDKFFYIIRGNGQKSFNISSLENSGNYYLRLTSDDKVDYIPFGKWIKEIKIVNHNQYSN